MTENATQDPNQGLKDFVQGVKIAAEDIQMFAPAISAFNPGIGAAVGLLTPVLSSVIIDGLQMIIEFRSDMTPEELEAALLASKSANWEDPGSIEPTV